MAVRGRLRFEILRRDKFVCRYCGRTPPDVSMTVDHVVPESLGGTDTPENLVSACTDCNSGKSSIGPDQAVVADVADDALRWSRAMQMAADMRSDERVILEDAVEEFNDAWEVWSWGPQDDRQSIPRDAGWEQSVRRWLEAGLPQDELIHLIGVAMKSKASVKETWRYYAGCCWRALDDLQAKARELLQAQDDGT